MGNNSNTASYLETKALFTQDGDACTSNPCQALEIKSQDGGGGTYYVIKTDRWAFDSIEELTSTIKKFIHADTAAKTKMKDVEITKLKLEAISYKAKIASLENKVQEQKDLIEEQSNEIQNKEGIFVFFWFLMFVVGILVGHFVPPLFTNG